MFTIVDSYDMTIAAQVQKIKDNTNVSFWSSPGIKKNIIFSLAD